jgi:ParB family chromosome partitioning protein
LKQEELGDRVGKNRSTVTNYLRLLKLPPDIQIALRDDKISMGHARAIINVENPESQLFIFKKTLAEDLSVRKVEEIARQVTAGVKEEVKAEGTAATTSVAPSKEITQLQSQLSSHFGTKVSIKSDGNRGEIKIPFLSVQDLNRLLDILKI